MANFNFNQTCPLIDDGERQIKDGIKNVIEEINEPLLQYMSEEQKNGLINEFYEQWFEDTVEQLRTTNSDMRGEAEYQLNEIENEYEAKIDELKNRIEELESTLADCERIHTEKGVLLP